MIRSVLHIVGMGQTGGAYIVFVGIYEGIFGNIKAHTVEKYKKYHFLIHSANTPIRFDLLQNIFREPYIKQAYIKSTRIAK